MRIARLATPRGARYAFCDGGDWHVADDPFGSPRPMGETIADRNARFLAPCEPRVVFAMAHNQWLPDGGRLPTQAFMKSARTVVGPSESIEVDPRLGVVQAEGELAAVIGRPARGLTRHNALSAVVGFTIGNDVTAVDQIGADSLLTQAKNGAGYTPLGPWIETRLTDPNSTVVRVLVDGHLRAQGSTAELVDGVVEQLVYITRFTTLGPGDVVLGGCPGTSAAVLPGQTVRIETDGLGALENRAVAPRGNGRGGEG